MPGKPENVIGPHPVVGYRIEVETIPVWASSVSVGFSIEVRRLKHSAMQMQPVDEGKMQFPPCAQGHAA